MSPNSPTKKSIAEAAKYYGCDYLLTPSGKFKEPIYRENFRGLGLVEMRISEYVDLAQIELRGKYWVQAPYPEFCLDEEGTELLHHPMKHGENSEFADTVKPGTRLCSLLHFALGGYPLYVASKRTARPKGTNLPERLVPFAHYLPVD